MHAYIHTYILTYILTYIQTHRQTQTDAQTHTDTHRHTQTHTDTHRHTHRHTHTDTHRHTHRHTSLTHTHNTHSHRWSDVRPGVSWSPQLCRWLLRGRRGAWCTAGGRMYPLASLGLRRSLVAFAWQVRYLVHCKGSDVRPGIPWSPPLRRWLLRRRRGTWCTARGRVYALASLGLRRSAGSFGVAGMGLGALQGVGCTPWEAWDLVHCKGSDVRPGVPWSPPLCRWLLHGMCATWCSARGRMYALASLGLHT